MGRFGFLAAFEVFSKVVLGAILKNSSPSFLITFEEIEGGALFP